MDTSKDVKLPTPTKGASDVVSFSTALIADALSLMAIPGAAIASRAIEKWVDYRLENARSILFMAIEDGNLSLLSDPNYESLVPNTLGYFESARRGEYNHNLNVLAKLLIGEFNAQHSDPGKIRRAARRIEAMTLEDLGLLVLLNGFFKTKRASVEFEGYHLCLDDQAIVRQMNREYVSPETALNSQLSDFVSRGLLFVGGEPGVFGGQFYYKTLAFDEIIAAAESTVSASA